MRSPARYRSGGFQGVTLFQTQARKQAARARIAIVQRACIVDLNRRLSYDGSKKSDTKPEMITFQIAGYLTEFAGGQAEVEIDISPATVGEALNQLWKRHVGLRDRVLTEQGEVRPHVNVFLNSQVVQRDKALHTAISGDAEICIMPAVSGGG